MKTANRATLQGLKRAVKDVPIGNDLAVRIVEMSGVERDEFDDYVVKRTIPGNKGQAAKITSTKGATTLLLRLSIVDEDGEKMFSDSKEDINALENLGSKVRQALYDAILALNGMTEETQQATKGN